MVSLHCIVCVWVKCSREIIIPFKSQFDASIYELISTKLAYKEKTGYPGVKVYFDWAT